MFFISCDKQAYSTNDIVRILQRFPISNNNNYTNACIPFEYQNKENEECTKILFELGIPHELRQNISNSLSSVIKILSWIIIEFDNHNEPNCISGIEQLLETSSFSIIQRKIKKGDIPFKSIFKALFILYSLLAIGFKSRLVIGRSILFIREGLPFIEVYVNDYNKWVAIDTNNSSIYIDENGVPLNVVEIRERLSNRKSLIIYSSKSKIHCGIYDEVANSIFAIQYYINNKIDMFTEKTIISYILTPSGFKGENKVINDVIENKVYKYIFEENASKFYI